MYAWISVDSEYDPVIHSDDPETQSAAHAIAYAADLRGGPSV